MDEAKTLRPTPRIPEPFELGGKIRGPGATGEVVEALTRGPEVRGEKSPCAEGV